MIKQNKQIYQSCHSAYWEICWYFPHRNTGKLNEVRILSSVTTVPVYGGLCYGPQNPHLI